MVDRFKQVNQKLQQRLLGWTWRFCCAVAPHQVPVFSLPDSRVRIAYPLCSAVGRALFMGRFEMAELAFVRRSLKPGNVFIDVGANCGIFTALAADLVGPEGHVFAFEPGLAEGELLQRNVETNGLSNVTFVDCAVSNTSGEAQFAVSKDGAMSSLKKTNHPGQKIAEWRKVKTTTVDEFLQKLSIQKVDFIKIDVEGGEKFVFEGARKFLSSARNLTILFEASDLNASGFGYSVKNFLIELRNMGLALHELNHDGSLIPMVDPSNPRFGKEVYNFVATI